MQIERLFSQRKILRTNVSSYDLEACRWKVFGHTAKKKKDISSPKSQGYIHGAVLLKTSIFVVVGPDEHSPQASLHSYNLKNNEWKTWPECLMPPARDSFGLTVLKNQIYLYGGSNYEEQFGDLHVFNTLNGFWNVVEGGDIPHRNPMVFTSVNNEFILLYGGINVATGEFLNDAFLLIDGNWVAIKQIIHAPQNLLGAKAVTCGRRLFMFGGQFNLETDTKQNSNLYQLITNVENLTLEFKEVKVASAKNPCGRVFHSMLEINRQYFIVVGGQPVSPISTQNEHQLLRDIWIFDVPNSSWVKIDPVNGTIRPICDNSLVIANNVIYIFGGMIEQLDMWNEQTLAIQFGQSEVFKNQICSNCIQRANQKDKEDKAFPKTLVVSSGFFYTISLEIKHPFQAVSILYDCAAFLKAYYFKFKIFKTSNQNEFINIEFDGKTLSKQQFRELICHSASNDPQYNKFITNIKVASMRLGKTFVFITADQNERKVFLFSADSKVTPAFDENYGFFAYVQNIETNSVQSHEGKTNRSLIMNVLRSRLQHPENFINIKNMNRILIFEKNILVTSEKTYYYELISGSQEDITIYKNAKKIQFLDELGYEISKEPEISLRSYAANMLLDPKRLPYFYVGHTIMPTSHNNYAQKLRNLAQEKQILEMEMPSKIVDIELDVSLYIAESPTVIQNNLGILIYYDGKLVNRLDVNFGDLFKQEFYKTKFKKAATLFYFLGIINVKKGLTLNYFGTWFKKHRGYYLFIEGVREAMRKAKLDQLERQLRVVAQDAEQRKMTKKIKL